MEAAPAASPTGEGISGATRDSPGAERQIAQAIPPGQIEEAHMANTLAALSASFRAVKAQSAHRQLGLRALKDAKALGDRNPARVEELLARAAYHLPYAEAAR